MSDAAPYEVRVTAESRDTWVPGPGGGPGLHVTVEITLTSPGRLSARSMIACQHQAARAAALVLNVCRESQPSTPAPPPAPPQPATQLAPAEVLDDLRAAAPWHRQAPHAAEAGVTLDGVIGQSSGPGDFVIRPVHAPVGMRNAARWCSLELWNELQFRGLTDEPQDIPF